MSSEGEAKILSYGDVVLHEDDLQLLNNGGWLNDRLLSFAADYISSELPQEKKRKMAILSPPLTEMAKNIDDRHAIASIFAELDLPNKEFVFFMLNDNADPTRANGGSHWTLLVYVRECDRFVHFNSSPCVSLNEHFAQRVAKNVGVAIGTLKREVEMGPCPAQHNGYDCGIFVIEFLRCIVERENLSSVQLLSAEKISSKRKNWFGLICQLSANDASSSMITPVFWISQDEEFLHIRIRAPHANIAELELDYGEFLFYFSCAPYFLRLHFKHLVEEYAFGRGTASYDSDSEFMVRVAKKKKGEHFEGLDLITELLRPSETISAREKVIEVEGDEEEEDGDCDGSEYLTEQTIQDVDSGIENSRSLATLYGYGFAWRRTGVLEPLQSEIGRLVDLEDSEGVSIEDRRNACFEFDKEHFDSERYLADSLQPEQELLDVISAASQCSFILTESNREFLKELPKKKLLKLSDEENHQVALSLIDILYAYAYELRVNDGEMSCEAGWTCSKLSPSFSFLCRWQNPKQVGQ
ncbi:unnamed protein product [Caenorhabditis auriculariae]|uniref:Protein SHQ1 homolog n=1 Tax=Caenorhabditis auriculariae TaxID=2777116 RepID=A0A8S1H751_9PELO|nr:unnamed protein product [Caenorhabditis auriculariae]